MGVDGDGRRGLVSLVRETWAQVMVQIVHGRRRWMIKAPTIAIIALMSRESEGHFLAQMMALKMCEPKQSRIGRYVLCVIASSFCSALTVSGPSPHVFRSPISKSRRAHYSLSMPPSKHLKYGRHVKSVSYDVNCEKRGLPCHLEGSGS